MSTIRSNYSRCIQGFLASMVMVINLGNQGVASAHPGHGITSEGASATHYMLEPSHGISIAMILVASVAAGFIIRHRAILSSNRTSV